MTENNSNSTTLIAEPVPIFETFTTGIAEINDCGDFVRVAYFVDRPLSGTLETERAIVARLIIPTSAYSGIVEAMSNVRPADPPAASSVR